jgi:hypothetical protein
MGTRITTNTRITMSARLTMNTVPPASFSAIVVNGTTSDTRVGTWSTSIDNTTNFDFVSIQDAKIFFDIGCELRIDLSHPTGSSQDNDWSTALGTRLGQIQFKNNGTDTTGTSSLTTTIGYTDLTSVYQLIVDGTNIGAGAYTTNDVLVNARTSDNGKTVIIRVTLQDQYTGSPDSVAAGTAANFTVLRAAVPSGIVTPTGTVANTFT